MGQTFYMEAREKATHKPFRRVGRHKRTGKFYWYGTLYAKYLRARKLLRGTITEGEIKDFTAWCSVKNLQGRNTGAQTKKDRAIEIARGEVGVHESPPGSNTGDKIRAYQATTTLGGTYWPWCAAFVVWVLLRAGYNLPREARTASVYYFTEWARKAGRIVERKPRPGDVVILFGPGKHMGLCVGVGNATIEGNTSSSEAGSQDNGGEVAARVRSDSQITYVIDMSGL